MSLATLKTVCAALMERDEADLTLGGVDMFLIAANNARKAGERRHNFERSRVTASLVIAGAAGGALSSVTSVVGEATAGIKEVIAVSQVTSSGLRKPLPFVRYDIAMELDRQEIEAQQDDWPVTRYPSDADILDRGYSIWVAQRGKTLHVYPYNPNFTDNITLQIEAIGWLTEYSAGNIGSVTDVFLEEGFDYLQWACLCELNAKFMRFVYRTEGQLDQRFLQQMRDEAWLTFAGSDSYSVDSNIAV